MMKIGRGLMMVFSIILTFNGYGQNKKYDSSLPREGNVEFKDTLLSMVTDSFVTNLGNRPDTNLKLTKYFKYLGKDAPFIIRAWTGDPHYICEYPKHGLIKDKIYSMKICFAFKHKRGLFSKDMGLVLSNGDRIVFRFKGNIIPEEKE